MLRDLGFSLVVEVAFGADLVARQYWELLLSCNGNRYISTTCPAIVDFRRALLSGAGPAAGPDRVADDRHGPGPARDLRREAEGRVHRALHRQEDGGRGRVGGRRDRRRDHVSRAAAAVRRGGHRSGPRRAQRFRPAPGLRRRPVSHQPRRAPGGQPPRRPAHRRNRGHAGPQPRAGSDQGVCRRRPGRQAAGSALLRRLHHGRRADQRPAAVQSPPPGADLRQPSA